MGRPVSVLNLIPPAHGAVITANASVNNTATSSNGLPHGAIISASVSANNGNYPSGTPTHGAIISASVAANNASFPPGTGHGAVSSRLVATCNQPSGCAGGVSSTNAPAGTVFGQDAVMRLAVMAADAASCDPDVEFEVNGMRIGRSKAVREFRFTVPAGSGELDFRASSGGQVSPVVHVTAGSTADRRIELKFDSLCKATQSDGKSDSKEKQQ
jgi:hypothetical protein